MNTLQIQQRKNPIKGSLKLSGSKSISNRVLIIRALCNYDFEIKNLSTSKDTVILEKALGDLSNDVINVGHAGTSYRFLTALLAISDGETLLTGSTRMHERPIGPLVNALNTIGASISYIEKEGYPPLRIGPYKEVNISRVKIDGSISSQFLSALVLIAPKLKNGLEIEIVGKLVSEPYLRMTLSILKYFGVKTEWNNNRIFIPHQEYEAKDFSVEGDWSSASYLYNLVALLPGSKLTIRGLFNKSYQGDSVIVEILEEFGVKTEYFEGGICITSNGNYPKFFEYDFNLCPDLAQSLLVLCSAVNAKALFSGLETLPRKETDRIDAMKNELAKVGIQFFKLPERFSKNKEKVYFMLDGELKIPEMITFEDYKDHRMIMSLSTLSCLHEVILTNPDVVEKSYVDYWKDLSNLGFKLILKQN